MTDPLESGKPMKTPSKPRAAPRETARRVLEIEARAVQGLTDRLDDGFDRAVDLLIGCAGRIIVTGMGKSGMICQKLAATLSSTGCPAYFMHPAEAVHGDLGMLVAGDVLLTISNSGETEEIVRLLELVRRLGAKIIALSGNPESTLGRNADVHLDVSVDQEACSWDLVPTASTTAAMAMADALAVAAYEGRGFSPQEFARNHPGGRLARKLQQVDLLMHTGDELPSVAQSVGIAGAVREINDKSLGMTCVVDGDSRLVGVLTDGDLRRRMLSETAPLEGNVTEAMTRNPARIRQGALASEALKIMEERKITSLPVVHENDRLSGVIQIHDLWRTELF